MTDSAMGIDPFTVAATIGALGVGYVGTIAVRDYVLQPIFGVLGGFARWLTNTQPFPIGEASRYRIEQAAQDIERRSEIVGRVNLGVINGYQIMKAEKAEIKEALKEIADLQSKLRIKKKGLADLKRAVVTLTRVDVNNGYSLWWNKNKIVKAENVIAKFLGNEQMRAAYGQTRSSTPTAYLPPALRGNKSSRTSQGNVQPSLVQRLIKKAPNPFVQRDTTIPDIEACNKQVEAVKSFLDYCRYNPLVSDCTRTVWNSEKNKEVFLDAALRGYTPEESNNIKLVLCGKHPTYLSREEAKKQQKLLLAMQQSLGAPGK